MTDKSDNFLDEEYEFADNDVTEEFAVLDDEPYQAPVNRGRRLALVAVGLIIVVFIVYQLLDYFNAPKEIQPVVTAPQPTEFISEQPEPITPRPVVKAALTDTVERSLEQLRAKNSDQGVQLDNLRVSTQSLQNALRSLNQNMEKLNGTVRDLVDEVARQRSELTQVRSLAEEIKHANAEPSESPASQVNYYIQALIPGRAWIKNPSSATTLTVSENSRIAGYGKVTLIDPQQGEIMTSSGRIIRFNPEDV